MKRNRKERKTNQAKDERTDNGNNDKERKGKEIISFPPGIGHT